MKARDIVGRRVVSIEQTTFWNSHLGKNDNYVTSITLDNGTCLLPTAYETETEPLVDFVVWKPKMRTT